MMHTTEQHRSMQRKSLLKMWAFVLLAACATAAQGQLDSTLGDVLGAIASVITIPLSLLGYTVKMDAATAIPLSV